MLDALIEAIIAGRMTLRQARVALALATRGSMGARKLEAVTGMDAQHCRRALAELRALGWPVDNLVDNHVDNSEGVGQIGLRGCRPNRPTGVGQIGLRGRPNRPTPTQMGDAPKPAPDEAFEEGVGRFGLHHAGSSGSSGSSKYVNTTTTTTTLAVPALLEAHRQQIESLLAGCAHEDAQTLIDECAGKLEAGHAIKSPLAYLRGLLKRHQAGEFVPEYAHKAASCRLASAEFQKAIAAREAAHLEEVKRVAPSIQLPKSISRKIEAARAAQRARRTSGSDPLGDDRSQAMA